MSTLDERVACVIMDLSGNAPASADLIRAIRDRSRPSATVMARYISSRIDAPDIVSALEHQFSGALTGARAPTDRSVASYSRFFHRFGSLTAKDWRALARLAVSLGRPSAHTTALDYSQSSRYCRRYLRTDITAASALLGWERVFEQGLVQAGYTLVQSIRPRSTHERSGLSLAP